MAAVAEEAVEVRAGQVGAAVRSEGGLEVRPPRMLPLPLVRVLVPAQRLQRREVAAAVVALEPPLPAGGCRRLAASLPVPGRSRRVLLEQQQLVGGHLLLVVVGEVPVEEVDAGGVPAARRRRCLQCRVTRRLQRLASGMRRGSPAPGRSRRRWAEPPPSERKGRRGWGERKWGPGPRVGRGKWMEPTG